MTDNNIFTCTLCGDEAPMVRSTEEAIAEYEEEQGVQYNPHDTCIVCDDCYHLIKEFEAGNGKARIN